MFRGSSGIGQAGRSPRSARPAPRPHSPTTLPGLLVRREGPDGAVGAFEHDAAGRITASVAPDGGRTELEYAPNGGLVRTIDPLGRSVERVFDELGNVTALVLPDGGCWSFGHDTLSRLIARPICARRHAANAGRNAR